MDTPLRVVYALDIGVYNLDLSNEVDSSTTAAWCRLTETPKSLYNDVDYLGCPPDYIEISFPDGCQALCGRHIGVLANHISSDIAAGNAVALGFEAPMWFPLTLDADSHKLFYPRFPVERGHEWYIQAGAAATVKAISLGILLFRLISKETTITQISRNPHCWTTSPSSLTLFEAFVAGGDEKKNDYFYKLRRPDLIGKNAKDEWDAFTAAVAWCGRHGYSASRRYVAISDSS